MMSNKSQRRSSWLTSSRFQVCSCLELTDIFTRGTWRLQGRSPTVFLKLCTPRTSGNIRVSTCHSWSELPVWSHDCSFNVLFLSHHGCMLTLREWASRRLMLKDISGHGKLLDGLIHLKSFSSSKCRCRKVTYHQWILEPRFENLWMVSNMKSCKASRLMDRDDGRWWQIIKLTKLNFSLCSNAENQNLDSFWSRTEWILEVVSLTLSLLVSLQVCHCSGKSFCHCDGVKGQQVRQSWPEQQVFTVSAANLGTDAWEAKLGQTGSHRVLDCSDFTDPGPAWVYSLLPSSGDPLSLQTHVTPSGADLDVDLM